MSNQKLINFLNQELSNFNIMYVKLHRYHWFVQGRHFYSLHQLFENLYNEMADDLDEIAERILSIGGKPLATMSKYLEETTLVEATADDKENEMISQLIKDYRQMVDEMKNTGVKLAEEVKDEPTVDLLNELQAKFEKHLWMLGALIAYE
ncbi:general stress protein [Heyndrickxia shackletonii]|uniref:General stress protein n=1 Tax=Heyndrickxia shackletonii TaxID=157838 RepID=A0A0Q3WY35_9BACI|nr:Dps family protein [Heyndrickxia shackletonii]KQL54021.1 general stress protein [Heyndrickxia shackletonii]MBB2478805.1 DNA starvation/stationary phase protection protein [Bacillus sp. APMAM]NEY97683.1 DNA starvation/stationary phase protection protein [Heyndrickxia shackletonii]RTZ57556.1 DNA starvation/stationary phase protection protein [Bacillus sp. SAJ1]